MSTPKSIPRLALRVEEAAAAIGVSTDAFREHVAPELRCVRRGRLKLYPVTEIQGWLDKEATHALEGDEWHG